MTDKKGKILERVRALIAKADSTNFPEEAASFRAKADELMTTYAIEQWQLDAIKRGEREMPEKREVDMSWYARNPFRDQLWTLFYQTAQHCRCQAVGLKFGGGVIPVVGMPNDLDYFDLIFTSLMLQMGKQIDPQPIPELSLEENLAALREAGLPWVDALNRLADAGFIEKSDEYRVHDGKVAHFSRKVYETTIRKYRAWCKRTGHDQSYVNQKTFRRNFADGFVDEIWTRFAEMRRAQETAYDADHKAGSMNLVMRDIKQVVKEAVWDFFPDLRPHPADCDCDRCHRCSDPKCNRTNCRIARQPVRYRSVAGPKIDYAAREAGRAAGRKADISASPHTRVGGRKGIEG